MTRSIAIFLILLSGTITFAQQKTNSSKKMDEIMDRNAAMLFKASKTYSISIGIVKDGKIYTKHYGEIDKGKGNRAGSDTYFEIASVTK